MMLVEKKNTQIRNNKWNGYSFITLAQVTAWTSPASPRGCQKASCNGGGALAAARAPAAGAEAAWKEEKSVCRGAGDRWGSQLRVSDVSSPAVKTRAPILRNEGGLWGQHLFLMVAHWHCPDAIYAGHGGHIHSLGGPKADIES